MLELIPASAIIAIVVIAIIVIFLAVGYVKAPPDMAFIISGIKKKSKIVIGKAAIRIPFFERLDKLQTSVGQKPSPPASSFLRSHAHYLRELLLPHLQCILCSYSGSFLLQVLTFQVHY